MTATQLQLSLELSENSKLIQIYGEDKFSTIVDGNLVYLLKTTKISRYNVIASLDVKLNCKIFNRDLANLFVDWSHEYFEKPGKIEDLTDEQIAGIIANYLEPDTVELLTFKPMEDYYKDNDNDFSKVIQNFYSCEDQARVFEGLCKLKVYAIPDVWHYPVAFAYTQLQSDYLEQKQYSYCRLNATLGKYDICSRDDNGKYIVHAKNGSTRKLKKPFDGTMLTVFFEQLPKTIEYKSKLEQVVKRDVEGSSYHVANRYIKLQSAYDKTIKNLIEDIQSTKGFIDLSSIEYPDFEVYAEAVALGIRKYKRQTALDEKQKTIEELTEVYSNILKETDKALKTVKHLKNLK